MASSTSTRRLSSEDTNGDDDSNNYQIDPDDMTPLLDGFQSLSTSHQRQEPSSATDMSSEPRLRNQYIACFCATLGAFSLGTILGYSSPAGAILSNYDDPNLNLTDTQLSWFSSTLNLGALFGGPVGGFFINSVGRRGAMLCTIVPWLVGWILIAAAQNFSMLVLGRIIGGLACGTTSLIVPTYIGEFSSPNIRGQLGAAFQLNVTLGILFAYCMGAAFDSFRWIACVCLVFPCLFFLSMIPNKESPNYLLAKGRIEQAKESLQYFRGKDYDVNSELHNLKENLERDQRNKISFKDLKTPYILKPLIISLGLMFFQQVSGINAVLFNLQSIFYDAGSTIEDNLATIIVGIVQVVATFVAVVLMDRVGRKILLLVSSSVMALSLVALGVFFFLKERAQAHPDLYDVDELLANLGWLPLVSLMVFILSFSIGYGPIPWLIMGEIFSSDVREIAASLATMTNWSMSFIVTLIFNPLKTAFRDSGSYWFFAAFNVASFIFVMFFVLETKGKTIDEITAHFGGPTSNQKKDTSTKSTTSP